MKTDLFLVYYPWNTLSNLNENKCRLYLIYCMFYQRPSFERSLLATYAWVQWAVSCKLNGHPDISNDLYWSMYYDQYWHGATNRHACLSETWWRVDILWFSVEKKPNQSMKLYRKLSTMTKSILVSKFCVTIYIYMEVFALKNYSLHGNYDR